MPDLSELYSFLWTAHGDDYGVLDQSLNPRPPEYAFELAAKAGVGRDSLVVDVGCGRGNHSVELANRFGCRSIGVDLVFEPLLDCSHPNVQLVQGSIERLPIPHESADFVWCRDMLVHLPNLAIGLRECRRILKPSGRMILYTTLETDLMEPREASRLYEPLAIQALKSDKLKSGFAAAGLVITHQEEIGGELIEFYQERDQRASRELMRLARMRRMREQLIAEWGRRRYETVYALYTWLLYLLLGKLTGAYYILERR